MTQYDRIKSGKATPAQIAAEIKTAGEKKAATSFKRLPAHDLIEDYLVPFGVEISDCIREGRINPKTMYAFIHGEAPLDNYLATKFSFLFDAPKEEFLAIQAKYA